MSSFIVYYLSSLNRIFPRGFHCGISSFLQKIVKLRKLHTSFGETYPTGRSRVLFSQDSYGLLFLVLHMVTCKGVPYPGFVFISLRVGAAPPPILL